MAAFPVNPARSLASALIGRDLGSIWINVVGRVVGAVGGWALHRALLAEPGGAERRG